MIFDRNITGFVIHEDASIQSALGKIAKLKGRVLFITDERDNLLGVLTNGDLIRWLSDKTTADLQVSVGDIANKSYYYAKSDDPHGKIQDLLDKVLYVPLLDGQGHLVAVARRRQSSESFVIEGKQIGESSPVFVIAEIGNNHNGSLGRAKKLVEAAAEAGADCAKFQLRDMATLYRNAGKPGEASDNLGSQYTLDLLSRFQLSMEELFKVMDYSRECGLIPLCTPWDAVSVHALEEYGVSAYKVASADLTNHDLLKVIANTGKPVICSTGMSREEEIKETVHCMQRYGVPYVLLHCNATYPPPFRDINLAYLQRLHEIGQCPVGYSGHERDIFIAVSAVALGAKVIEKHFTLDQDLEGSDHKISLLPNELARMVVGIRQVEEALGSKDSGRQMSQGELLNRSTLAKSVYINRDIEKGDFIDIDMLEVMSPGQGLQPNRKYELIGRVVQRAMKAGEPFYPSDLDDVTKVIQARPYKFNRPWGIPVRYHDYRKLLEKSNPTLLEFHFGYKDLELNISDYFSENLAVDLVVHSPELFAGDHVLDLCSMDDEYRHHSINELQRVIEITKNLRQFFTNDGPIGIVTNVGGFSMNRPLSRKERQDCRANLKKSLAMLDMDGVEIWPQTMPPYPWHFGGQRYHNLFVTADEISSLCQENELKICFDVSHSKLACNHRQRSFKHFAEQIAPYVAHLHMADASGLDGEGLQVGDGNIDFIALADVLAKYAPKASMIPEVWQGHENGGEGFWDALERLEQYY